MHFSDAALGERHILPVQLSAPDGGYADRFLNGVDHFSPQGEDLFFHGADYSDHGCCGTESASFLCILSAGVILR